LVLFQAFPGKDGVLFECAGAFAPSAAGGGRSEARTAQRSKNARKCASPQRFSGTARGRVSIGPYAVVSGAVQAIGFPLRERLWGRVSRGGLRSFREVYVRFVLSLFSAFALKGKENIAYAAEEDVERFLGGKPASGRAGTGFPMWTGLWTDMGVIHGRNWEKALHGGVFRLLKKTWISPCW